MLRKAIQQAGALFAALCLLLSCGAIGAGAAYGRFSDVSPIYALAGEIERAAESGLVGGYADGTFRPDLPLSRGAFVKMIASAFAAKGYDMPVTTQHYTGVYASYAAFVETRSREVGGYTDELRDILSSLSEPATRYDAICVMAGVSERNVTIAGGVSAQQYVSFDDADPTLMALITRVEGAPGLRNIIAGFADNTVRAGNVLKRAHGVAYAVRYGDSRIEEQGEWEESYLVVSTNGKTATQLRKELLSMTFSDPAFADTLGQYLYALDYFKFGVSVNKTHGGNLDGLAIVTGHNGRQFSVSIQNGVCTSSTAVGQGLIGVTAPITHSNPRELLAEVDRFTGASTQPHIDPIEVPNVKAYTDDDNHIFFWLSFVPDGTQTVEFAISGADYTIISDAKPGELNGNVNLFDNFTTFGTSMGDADYVVQWVNDAGAHSTEGAVIASVFGYNNDYPDLIDITATIYTADATHSDIGPIELKVPVYDGGEPVEPEPMPGFVTMDASVSGEDMTVNVYNLRESGTIVISTFGGNFGISLGRQEIPVEPTGNGGCTVHVVLNETEAAPGSYHWVSLVDMDGNDLVSPIRVEGVPLGDYDNFITAEAAA